MDWIAFFIGLIGLYYNGRKEAVCWLIFIGSSFCWLLHWGLSAPNLHEVESAAVVMSVVAMGLHWQNYRTWRRGEDVPRKAEANDIAGHVRR